MKATTASAKGVIESGINAAFPDHLFTIERRLWTNDAVFYKDNLTDDCLLVFPETGVITRDVAVDAIRKENEDGRKWAEVDFSNIRKLRLAEDAALLTYRVTARWQHERFARTALASSLYIKRDGGWKLAFHQQTPIKGSARQ
jgi:hypothetical protein